MQDPIEVARIGELLAAHVAVDAAEAGFVRECQTLLASPKGPFSRHHFEPGHFTASAFVLSPDGGELLLIHHRKLQRWLQPGGHFEPGDDDVFSAARREVAEETGLIDLELERPGLLDVDIHDIPPLADEPAHRHFDLRVSFRAGTRELRAGAEVKAARWYALSEIDAALADASVVRAIRRLA